MKRIIYIALLIGVILWVAGPLQAETKPLSSGDVCEAKCRLDEGIICLERGPCEPINDFLLKAAKECRENPASKYMPITKLLFVDILCQVLRLDREAPGTIDNLSDGDRYIIKTRLLSDKGIDMFVDTMPLSPLTREELTAVLRNVSVEKDLGFSTGLPGQIFDLKNEEFIIYDLEIYVDNELWKRTKKIKESLPHSKHYVAKLDSCNDANVVFGDNEKGKIPDAGSGIKALYKFYGRDNEIVTECEIAMLLSNPDVTRSIKDVYNPSRPLTKANFADLLIRIRHLQGQMPKGFQILSDREIYALQIELLASHGISIFIGSDPYDFLTREELARVLYDCPVEEVVGISDGTENQSFALSNAGFVIYDLHTYVNEDVEYEEWGKEDSFLESSSNDRDYLVKLDSGSYVTVYFGDGRKGRIPAENSPVKVRYRLYAPVTMLTEDDVICMLGRCVPVAETYVPPTPPFEFPDPPNGYDDPASPY